MRKYLLMLCVLFCLACSESHSQRNYTDVNGILRNGTNGIEITNNAIPTTQSGYLVNIASFNLKNNSGSAQLIESIEGIFTSSNTKISLISYRVLIDGSHAQYGLTSKVIRPYTSTVLDISTSLSPGQTRRIDIMVLPAAFSSSGTLAADTIKFDADSIIVDGANVPAIFPEITVNPGFQASNGLSPIAIIVPTAQNSGASIKLHSENLFNSTNLDQLLHDIHIRFSSGPRNARKNSNITGEIQLHLDGQLVQTIPVGSTLTTEDFKLNMFSTLVRSFDFVEIEFFLVNHNCSPGDTVYLDRISVGSNLGIATFPTLVGAEITCN